MSIAAFNFIDLIKSLPASVIAIIRLRRCSDMSILPCSRAEAAAAEASEKTDKTPVEK